VAAPAIPIEPVFLLQAECGEDLPVRASSVTLEEHPAIDALAHVQRVLPVVARRAPRAPALPRAVYPGAGPERVQDAFNRGGRHGRILRRTSRPRSGSLRGARRTCAAPGGAPARPARRRPAGRSPPARPDPRTA